MSKSHFVGHNLWILKVNQLNRGRGIHVFNSLQQLYTLITQLVDSKFKMRYLDRTVQDDLDYLFQKLSKSESALADKDFGNVPQVEEGVKTSTFVIQKYIEDPLLIDNRKFDLRIWVLMTHERKVYVFKEGYVRTSCEPYSLKDCDVDKQYIHLTNNAVQKYSTEYGKYEDGNQLSFQVLEEYLRKNDISFEKDCLPRILDMIVMSKPKCFQSL